MDHGAHCEGTNAKMTAEQNQTVLVKDADMLAKKRAEGDGTFLAESVARDLCCD